MAFWVTDAEDRKRFEKVSPAARLLYIDAGAWAMEQVYKKRVAMPDGWFIPASLVRDWGKKNVATVLVREGLWERAERDGVRGFTYGWIRWENTPGCLGRQREDDRDAQRRHRSAKGVVNVDEG